MKIVQALCTLSLGVVAFGAKKMAPAPEPKVHTKTVKVEVAPIPYCPDGSEYGPAGCAFFETAEPEIDCPHPYKMSGKTCVTETHGESATVCPKGSYLDGKHCITEITEPANTYCKKGHLSKEGCVVRHEDKVVEPKVKKPDYECPKGFKLKHHTCISEQHFEAVLECDKGFDLVDGKCLAVETAPVECKKGTLNKGGCVETHIASPKPVCPKHTKFDGKGGCVSKEKTKPIKVCEKGYELHGKKCVTEVMVQAMPTKKGMEVDVKCHGREDEKGNCFQKHTSEATEICEKGFQLEGKHCVSYVSVPAELECPKGYETAAIGTKADCVKTKVYKAKCPHGFDEDKKGGCSKVHKSKPASVCPKGTDGHKKCTTVEEVEPTPVCPKGHDLTKAGCVQPGYTVPGDSKVYEPKVDCPKGFKLDEKNMVCTKQEKSKPAVVCEKGYELHGHKCQATHTIPPLAMCPKGFVGGKDGKGCTRVTYEKPHFKCPKGTEGHGKKCYVEEVSEPWVAPQPTKVSAPAPTKKA